MKKIILASLLAFGLTSSAMASEDGSGAYIGLAYGATAFSNGDGTTSISDDTDSGYKVYGGYQFNKIVGVEATYTDYGTFKYHSGKTLEASSIAVAANLGYTFLDGQLRPFGLIGVSSLSLDQNHGAVYDDDKVFAVTYGVGVEYSPKMFQGVGFRAMWNVDAYSVQEYTFSDSHVEAMGMFSAAVQYKF